MCELHHIYIYEVLISERVCFYSAEQPHSEFKLTGYVSRKDEWVTAVERVDTVQAFINNQYRLALPETFHITLRYPALSTHLDTLIVKYLTN